MIAGLAASRAATALTDEQLESLAEYHAAFVAATDADAETRWNHRFHRVINQAGGSASPRVGARAPVVHLPVRYFEFVPNWAEISAGHHARILAASSRCVTRTRRSA